MEKKVVALVACGGAGSRLWPLSRAGYPKQFLSLAGDRSLLTNTLSRLDGLGLDHTLLVGANEHRFLIAEQMKLSAQQGTILLEPVSRNTTATGLAGSHYAAEKFGPDTIIVFIPADHVVGDDEAFRAAVRSACAIVDRGWRHLHHRDPADQSRIRVTVTLKRAALLRISRQLLGLSGLLKNQTQKRAQSYLDSGNFLWNSGIFVFEASGFLNEARDFVPEIVEHTECAVKNSAHDLDFLRLDEDSFARCENISVDYAMIEKASHLSVVEANYGWSDIGSFDALQQWLEEDEQTAVTRGNSIVHDSPGSLIWSEGQLVAAAGLKDTIVIATSDVVYVAPKDRSQETKRFVEELKLRGLPEAKENRKVYRPWGTFEILAEGHRFKVKEIVVKPGGLLSLQKHYHRSEHWVVVSGTAKVILGDTERLLTENESVFVPVGEVHRLENPGKLPVHLIEVQSGSYLGEGRYRPV